MWWLTEKLIGRWVSLFTSCEHATIKPIAGSYQFKILKRTTTTNHKMWSTQWWPRNNYNISLHDLCFNVVAKLAMLGRTQCVCRLVCAYNYVYKSKSQPELRTEPLYLDVSDVLLTSYIKRSAKIAWYRVVHTWTSRKNDLFAIWDSLLCMRLGLQLVYSSTAVLAHDIHGLTTTCSRHGLVVCVCYELWKSVLSRNLVYDHDLKLLL